MTLTGPQARAARILIEWPRDKVARLADISVEALTAFERGRVDPGEATQDALRAVLEQGGAVFIDEDTPGTPGGGVGVRLKWARKDARQINRMESEGGPVGDDDV